MSKIHAKCIGASDLYASNCHGMDPNVTMNNALVLPFYSNKYKYIDVENYLKYTRKSQAQYKFYITKCFTYRTEYTNTLKHPTECR